MMLKPEQQQKKRMCRRWGGGVPGIVRCSTYIIVQRLSLQVELRGGGVGELRGEAQVWELHAATDEEH